MRVWVCWSNYSGYTAACWRELAARPGVELRVVAFGSKGQSANTSFKPTLLEGLDVELVDPNDAGLSASVAGRAADWKPDVMVLPGWMGCYRGVAREAGLASVPKVITSDHSWSGSWKQRATSMARRGHVRRFAAAMVPGERGYQFIQRHGMERERVFTLMYGYDAPRMDPIGRERVERGGDWPRRFAFVGRYVEQKNVRAMVEAYRAYRARVTEPWALVCYGRGPEGRWLEGVEGVTDYGFCDPLDLPGELGKAGALVLPSRYEPWGVVTIEALATGMPVIVSRVCGSSTAVTPLHTGLHCEHDSVESLTDAMVQMSDMAGDLPNRVADCQSVARAYAPDRWSDQWLRAFAYAVEHPR